MTARTPRVQIEVTEEIIRQSTQRDSSHCMIAEAVKAAVPHATRVSVDLQTIRFSDLKNNRRYIYLTPRVAQEALLDFDQGANIAPFTVRLRGAQVVPVRRDRKSGSRATAKHLKNEEAKQGRVIPEVTGGSAPPIGALATGPGSNNPSKRVTADGQRTGRRREYGLKAMTR